MSQEKQINWQYADEYYKFLLEMQKTIRLSYHYEDYETAFKDLEQIYLHLHREIETNKETTKYHKIIEDLIKKINDLIYSYNKTQIKSSMPTNIKMKIMTKIKHEIKQKVSELYMIITRIITDLNMLFPKVKTDNGLPIYQR